MVTSFTPTPWIVAQLTPFLSSVARQHARIQIHSPASCPHPLPKPARQVAKNLFHFLLLEPTKESREGRYTGHFPEIKNAPQRRIESDQRRMGKSPAPSPNRYQKGLHHLRRIQSPVTPRLWQWRFVQT